MIESFSVNIQCSCGTVHILQDELNHKCDICNKTNRVLLIKFSMVPENLTKIPWDELSYTIGKNVRLITEEQDLTFKVKSVDHREIHRDDNKGSIYIKTLAGDLENEYVTLYDYMYSENNKSEGAYYINT